MTENCQPALNLQMQLGECPLWHPHEGALYWVDIDGCAVHRLSPATATHTSWPMPTEPGCIALHEEGGLLVALRSGLARLDTESGKLSMLQDAPYDQQTTRFNDGRCDVAGRLWVGGIYEPRDQAGAALYCVDHNTLTDSGKRATVSNGLAFSIDHRTMYHSDTSAHRIFAYDYDLASGTITGERIFHAFDSDRKAASYGGRPDGGAVDSEGAYWAAMFEGGRLVRLSAEGDILQEIPLPVRCPTMMAFGDDDLRTLYITSASKNRSAEELARYPLSGCLLKVRVDVPGVAESFYRG